LFSAFGADNSIIIRGQIVKQNVPVIFMPKLLEDSAYCCAPSVAAMLLGQFNRFHSDNSGDIDGAGKDFSIV
jgi:hypothetical protein